MGTRVTTEIKTGPGGRARTGSPNGPMLPRRRLLASAAALGAGCLLPSAVLSAPIPPSDRLAFSVWRKGSRIGDHRLAFRRDGDRLTVEVAIDLEITLGFVTLFRYTHRNTEVWSGNRLLALDSETYDDGNDYRLSVREAPGGLQVDGWAGRFLAPADTLSSSYWNPETVYRSTILDTQRGYLMDVDTEWLGRETVAAAAGPVAADRYRISGDLSMDIWYSDAGQWVKLDFDARGAPISYQLA